MTKGKENGIAYHTFTVTAYHRMAKYGILAPDARVELIAGKILDMSPIGKFHAACVNRLNRFFAKNINLDEFLISIQNPIRLDKFNEPEPDV